MSLLGGIFGYVQEHHLLIILGAISVYIIVHILSALSSSSKCLKNPFAEDSRKPVQPFVENQALRDQVLKQGFSQKKLPGNLDAIVIGSGIGGLSTAAMLAKAGKKVLVLEQHDQAGGCCHTFTEKGFEFDVGIHYVGKMVGVSTSKTLLDQISDGQIVWTQIDDTFDIVALGKPGAAKIINMKVGVNEYRQNLLSSFPDDQVAVNKFLDDCKACEGLFLYFVLMKILPIWLVQFLIKLPLLRLFTNYYKFTEMSLSEYMDRLTDNLELRATLSYCWGDYGTPPHQASFIMHATLINHFQKSACYPIGGASQIAMNIIPVIERTGGRVLVRANVSDILCRDGTACGVRVKKGNEEIDVYAPIVVSAAGVFNTLRLLPVDVAKSTTVYELVEGQQVERGAAALSLFVGLRGGAEELQLKGHNAWALTSPNLVEAYEDYLHHTPDPSNPQEIPLLFIGFPSVKDPLQVERNPDKSTCAVITLANWEWFESWQHDRVKRRGDDYEALKSSLANQMWKQTCILYPQLEDKVEYFELGSPLSNNYYLGSGRGEIYGADHGRGRFSPNVALRMRADIGVPGLYISGQDILTCGFSGAMYSGLLTASAVLGRNLMTDLTALHNKLAKQASPEAP